MNKIARITCHQPSRQICLDDVPLDLTTIEYEIMARLVQSAGSIVERERLLSEVFDREFHRENRALDMHISNLRRKLGDDAAAPWLIETIPQTGYRLVAARDMA